MIVLMPLHKATVDVIVQALEEKGINRYMVEVGGEVRTRD